MKYLPFNRALLFYCKKSARAMQRPAGILADLIKKSPSENVLLTTDGEDSILTRIDRKKDQKQGAMKRRLPAEKGSDLV
jgi:hypothetical protein